MNTRNIQDGKSIVISWMMAAIIWRVTVGLLDSHTFHAFIEVVGQPLNHIPNVCQIRWAMNTYQFCSKEQYEFVIAAAIFSST